MTCNLIPIDLTGEQQAQVCGVLSVGCDWHTAANFAGCSLADIRRSMQNSPQFAARVQRAEAGVELSQMRVIQEAAKDPKNWRTAVWWLERHAPERFGPRSAGVVTARQLKAFIAILADVLNGGEQSPIDPTQIIARLKSFSGSVERLLRDERMQEANSFDAFELHQQEPAVEPEVLPNNAGDSNDENST
jgi:hypothetical protein